MAPTPAHFDGAAAANERTGVAPALVRNLVALLDTDEPNDHVHALTQLREYASRDALRKRAVCDMGAVPRAVRLLGSGGGSEASASGDGDINAPSRATWHRVQRAVLELLLCLSSVEHNQAAIVDAGAVPLLVDMACALDDDDDGGRDGARGGDVHEHDSARASPAARQRRTRADILRLHAAATLCNLAMASDNKRVMGDMGVVERLATMLRDAVGGDGDDRAGDARGGGASGAVVREVSGALRNLCLASRDNQARLAARRDAVAALEQLQRTAPLADTRHNAAALLQSVATVLSPPPPAAQPQPARASAARTRERRGAEPQQQQYRDESDAAGPAVGAAVGAAQAPLDEASFPRMRWQALRLDHDKLGAGTYSDVYRGTYRGYPVAVKVLKEPVPSQRTAARDARAARRRLRALLECHFMNAARHPNVLLLMGVCETPERRLVIVSELCERGSLKDAMAVVRSPVRRMQFARDIVSGLNWLHACNIVHRDLKPANLLVSAEWRVKLTDFGLSLNYRPDVRCEGFKGNVKYSAPEILAVRDARRAVAERRDERGARRPRHSHDAVGSGAPRPSCARVVAHADDYYPYAPSSDTYAFALMLWELASAQPLFEGLRGKDEITHHVCGGHRPPLDTHWPPAFRALLARCWHADPRRRPAFSELQRTFGAVAIEWLFAHDTATRAVAQRLWGSASYGTVDDAARDDDIATAADACAVVVDTSSPLAAVPYARVERLLATAAVGGGGGADAPVVDDDVPYVQQRVLRALLCGNDHAAGGGAGGDTADHVTLERFYTAAHHLAPLAPLSTHGAHMEALVRRAWFFGALNAEAARRLLHDQWRVARQRPPPPQQQAHGAAAPTGLFLVRFSTTAPGAYAIETIRGGERRGRAVTMDRRVAVPTAEPVGEGGRARRAYVLAATRDAAQRARVYATLNEAVAACCAPRGIAHGCAPARGSPYAHLFE